MSEQNCEYCGVTLTKANTRRLGEKHVCADCLKHRLDDFRDQAGSAAEKLEEKYKKSETTAGKVFYGLLGALANSAKKMGK